MGYNNKSYGVLKLFGMVYFLRILHFKLLKINILVFSIYQLTQEVLVIVSILLWYLLSKNM